MTIDKLLLCIGITTLLIISSAGFAAPKGCRYTDNFSVVAPDQYRIKTIDTLGNMKVEKQGPVNFSTGCKADERYSNGYAIIDVSDGTSHCELYIKDGPYMINPTIAKTTCKGNFQFDKMKHHMGSYLYQLFFSIRE